MNSFKLIASAVLVATAGFAGAVSADDALPAVPVTPAPVYDLISAQPFVLDQAYSFAWRKERPQVTAGYVLVLSVNPNMVYPRETLQPVLYGGTQTIERINHGYESGKVIAILPSTLTEQGTLALDLTQAPIWFGTPELPERVDAAKINGEMALRNRAGIKAFSAAKVAEALKTGGPQVSLADKAALLVHLAPLISQHSPQEKELADQFLDTLPTPKKETAGKK